MSGGEAEARHQRIRSIFLEFMTLPELEWRARLDQLRGEDAGLRQELESLLRHQDVETSDLAPRASFRASGAVIPLVPGDAISERYTMEERVGGGGMGEVWRAHDEMLGDTVALKFLRSPGADWSRRLLREASLARRVSHPNVCRVHDAGEVGGTVFLSMEFVSGSDLARCIHRDGPLQNPRARKLANELVDGLAVVHSLGLLHRDLKPGNVLLDEQGRALISDFGLAMPVAEATPEHALSGTHLYMAPEQLRGGAPSEASDVFALGLTLYEALTGRRAFRSAERILEASRLGALPPRPSTIVQGVDPILECITLRCLDPDPDARPTATELKSALAEEDPLAAALSLGAPPSAQILEHARSRPPMSTAGVRWLLLALLGSLLLTWGARWIHDVHLLPEPSPSKLAEKARTILSEVLAQDLGEAPFEVFGYANEVPQHAREGFELLDRPSQEPTGHHFWYRRSSAPLWPQEATSQLFGFGRVRAFDPAPGEPGSSCVVFDRSGRLVFLDSRETQGRHSPAVDPIRWEHTFEFAGLNFSNFSDCPPLPARAAQGERQFAWESQGGMLRVEAAIAGRSLVSFEVLARQQRLQSPSDSPQLFFLLNAILITALFALGMPRALRHFRSGRGDLRVSLRVSLLVSFCFFGAWLLHAHFPAYDTDLFAFVIAGAMSSLALGVLCWILSVAIEPSVQNDWPRTYVTWSRLFRKGVRSPSVRADLLTGFSLGALLLLVQALLGQAAQDPADQSPAWSEFEWSTWSATIFEGIAASLLLCLELVAILALLFWLLRGKRRAAFGAWAIAVILSAGSTASTGAAVMAALSMSLILFSLLRYGLLTALAVGLVLRWFENTPIAPSLADWYAPYGLATLLWVTLLGSWLAWPMLRRPVPASAVG